MPKQVAKRFILEGRVQGVGCRAQIHDLVHGIGHLSGFVRNLWDGNVEICVKGPDWRVNDLEDVLRNRMHPPVRVDRVTVEELSERDVLNNGFVISRDA